MIAMDEAKKLNLVSLLKEKRELDDKIGWVFYFQDLFREIEKYMEKNNGGVFATWNTKRYGLWFPKGLSPISFLSQTASLWGPYSKNSPEESKYFGVDMHIRLYNNERSSDRPTIHESSIDIPCVLAENFNKKDFSAWIRKLKTEKNKIIEEKERKEYERLKKKHGKERRK